MKAILPTLACLLLCGFTFLHGQSQEVLFEKSFGGAGSEEGFDVLETQDGGLLLIGSTDTESAGLSDFYLVKTDADGEEEWSLTHGGFNNDIPRAGIELSDGSFIIVGLSSSFAISLNRDVYYIKVDADGTIVWTESVGGNETDEGTGIVATFGGGFMIAANTESYGPVGSNAWLINIDSLGQMQSSTVYGGLKDDYIWDIKNTADGGFITVGSSNSYIDTTESELWIAKSDFAGAPEWDTTFGIVNSIDLGWKVAVVDDGYVATGIHNDDPTMPGPLTGDAFLIKTDLQGNLLWDNSITSNTNRLEATGIFPTHDKGFILSGIRVDDNLANPPLFWVAKTDSMGDVQWEHDLGVESTVNGAYDVIQASNGDYVAIGFSGFEQTNQPDLHLVRIADSTFSTGIATNYVSSSVNLTVYPNPTIGPVSISWESNQAQLTGVRVRSMTGQIVYESTTNGVQNTALTTSINNAGIYFVEGIDKNGNLLGVNKLVVAK